MFMELCGCDGGNGTLLSFWDSSTPVRRSSVPSSRSGVQVFGFDHEVEHYGFRSKLGLHTVSPNPRNRCEFVEFLAHRARQLPERLVLLSTSDAFVTFVSENREELEPIFSTRPAMRRISVGRHQIKLRRTARAAHAGVPIRMYACPRNARRGSPSGRQTPGTRLSSSPTWTSLARELQRRQGHSRRRGRAARLLFREVLSSGQSALVQSLIVGPNTNHCKVCAYFDGQGQARAVIVMRKVRQYPVDFGVGTLMETVVEPEVQDLGLRLFRALDWRGPGSIEFKPGRPRREVEADRAQSAAMAAERPCGGRGMNFRSFSTWISQAERQTIDGYRVGVRWLDEFRDPRSAWEHKKRGALTVSEWARSFSGVRAYALWAADDPAPFLAAARHHFSSAWRRFFEHSTRSRRMNTKGSVRSSRLLAKQ